MSPRWFNRLTIVLAAVFAAACGGGGAPGSSGGGGTGGSTQTVAIVAVTSSAPTVPAGSSTVTITATVTDSAGKPVAGKAVSFSTTAGTLTEASTTTGSDGTATAKLGTAGDAAVRASATVTATSGGVSGSAVVSITAPLAAAVEVISSLPEVLTGGLPVTITAFVKDASNVAISGAPVTFSSDTGFLSEAGTVTNASGVATAKFGAGANRSNRPATITVTSGAQSGAVTLSVTGTKLQVSGPTTLRLNDASTLTAKLTDGTGNAISNTSLTASNLLAGNLPVTSATTDAQGTLTLSYDAKSSGTDKVIISGGGVSATLSVIVSGENFSFSLPAAGTTIPVGTTKLLTVTYLVNNVPQVGVPVSFNATAGQLSASTATTGTDGTASVSISASTASPATVQASFASGGVSASATLPIEFVATTPSRLVLQVTPTAIPPNLGGSTVNQAQIVARVTDANGNPVKDKTVNFSRDVDPSGGNLLQPSAVTDSSGVATVQYVSGISSTASDGVILRGTEATTGVTGTTKMTVSSAALFIALGTGNTISNLDPQTYKKDYIIYVTDANGVAVPNVNLTVKALPTRYRKGRLAVDLATGGWGASEVAQQVGVNLAPGEFISCANEDLTYGEGDPRSFNGLIDVGDVLVAPFAPSEDANSSGTLEPGNVISVSPGNPKTDAAGRTTISLIYAESFVPWVEIRLQVQAIVSGTESSTSSTFVVRGAAEDFSASGSGPAGVISPFGYAATCTKAGSY